MAPHDFVEIRLVCKADYLDPQLKVKLHEIKHRLREILHTGRRRFALKKVQPWNSVKVTFDIPKEAADRLHLLAVQGNVHLTELGILSVEIVGQSNTIVVNSNNNKGSSNNRINATTINSSTTNSKDLSVPTSSSSSSSSSSSAIATITKNAIDSHEPAVSSSSAHGFPFDNKTDEHRPKRVKIENGSEQQNYSSVNNFSYKPPATVNLMQPSSTISHSVSHCPHQQVPQVVQRSPVPSHTPTSNYGRMPYPNSISPTHPTYLNSGKLPRPQPPNPYQTSSALDNSIVLSNGIGNEMHTYHHHDSWSMLVDHSNNYKMKVNGILPNHYYNQQQQQQQQQQQLILSDSSSSSNIYCAQQYDMRRCETNIPQMTTSTNLQNSYDGSSTGLSS